MKQMGIEPNVATYSAMIDQYVKDGTSEGIRLGRELLEKMEKMAGARPNEITYTSFLMVCIATPSFRRRKWRTQRRRYCNAWSVGVFV